MGERGIQRKNEFLGSQSGYVIHASRAVLC